MKSNSTIKRYKASSKSKLKELLARLSDATPAMKGIAQELLTHTEFAFMNEGPNWPPLAPKTISHREKLGLSPHPILQITGALARSVTTEAGKDYAQIGSNLVYAAIHQLGGVAGKNRSVAIPARPYLPLDANGKMPNTTRIAIIDIIETYLNKVFRK